MPPHKISAPCPRCGSPRMVRNEPQRIAATCKNCHCRQLNIERFPLSEEHKAAKERYRTERRKRFLPTKHPLYRVWQNMCQRCENPKNEGYKYYGARGIFVCEEWRQSPGVFIEWAMSHGYSPELEIDRRNNDGPYSPENCRYVTSAVNMHNSRRTKRSLEQVREIKQRISSGQRNRDIALHLQVDPRRVADIKTGKAFASV